MLNAVKKAYLLVVAMLYMGTVLTAQPGKSFTHADTLKGSVTPQRAWWDVLYYDLAVKISIGDSSVSGSNTFTYKVVAPSLEMQIDLMKPLWIDSIMQDGRRLAFRRDGNAYFAMLQSAQEPGSQKEITVWYQGKPIAARNAPWDGGIVWATDSLGRPWIASACQTMGASVWWPCKDIQADEPDSQRITITVPGGLMAVSNGRLESKTHNDNGSTTCRWFVVNPINDYNIALNAGYYAHFSDTFQGEKGALSLDYWPLDYNLAKAEKQFQQVKSMLKCFEYWFGPYPWYEDGYKLVETPHLGMEHQSCVAYGNHYMNGYLGRDLSNTGWGLKWDFIIIHESGHEWFGNNITTKDIADMWVHEGFTTYSESLYVECLYGKKAGAEYMRGMRSMQNDRPVTGHYGVHDKGSGDMYNKGANMLHTIRQIINDDEKWRQILRGLNEAFWHQTVTGSQIQAYMNRSSGMDFSKVFQQYLTTPMIPVLEYRINGATLSYRWRNVVDGFDMPLKIFKPDGGMVFLYPRTAWQTTSVFTLTDGKLKADDNFLIKLRKLR